MKPAALAWGVILCMVILGCIASATIIFKKICCPATPVAITFYTEIPAVLESAYAYPDPEPRWCSGLRYVSVWKCEYGRIASEKEEVFMFAHDRGLITVGRVNGDLQVISVRELEND